MLHHEYLGQTFKAALWELTQRAQGIKERNHSSVLVSRLVSVAKLKNVLKVEICGLKF